jgi:uncharacterized membrane protein
MDWGAVGVQWLHIFFGTFWFGGTLYANFVMIPAIATLSMDRQRPIIEAIATQANRIIPLMAGAAIVLGFVRGTVFGDIKDLNGLSTTYGIEWLVGLIAAVATFAWGQWVLGPAAARFMAQSAPDPTTGQPPADAAARLARLKTIALLELLGFLVIFTTMILMHFAGEA